jgi:hypothetical protein
MRKKFDIRQVSGWVGETGVGIDEKEQSLQHADPFRSSSRQKTTIINKYTFSMKRLSFLLFLFLFLLSFLRTTLCSFYSIPFHFISLPLLLQWVMVTELLLVALSAELHWANTQ